MARRALSHLMCCVCACVHMCGASAMVLRHAGRKSGARVAMGDGPRMHDELCDGIALTAVQTVVSKFVVN